MKKNVCISPVDEEMSLLADALGIVNEFRRLGYETRKNFVAYVVDRLPEYANLEGLNMLNNLWAVRVKNAKLNDDLRALLQAIKK